MLKTNESRDFNLYSNCIIRMGTFSDCTLKYIAVYTFVMYAGSHSQRAVKKKRSITVTRLAFLLIGMATYASQALILTGILEVHKLISC